MTSFTGHHIWSLNPTITSCFGTSQDIEELAFIPPLPAGLEADVVFEHASFYFFPNSYPALARRFAEYDDRSRRTLVVSAGDQCEGLIQAGVSTYQCNELIFCREWEWPLEHIPRLYPAIYVARLDAIKRHQLAAAIGHYRLLAGAYGPGSYHGRLDQGYAYLEKLGITNAVLDVEARPSAIVAREIAHSGCGLALSMVEGGMRASFEYLLCLAPLYLLRPA